MIKFIITFIVISFSFNAYSQSNNSTVVKQLADSLQKLYVYKDQGVAMSSVLRSNLISNKYDQLQGEALASTLEKDLREIVNDKHLSIYFGQPKGSGKKRTIPNYNHSISESRILDGNIGYFEITLFRQPDIALREYLSKQLNRLKNTKSIIIDLRNNGGGSPECVQLLASYFIDYEPGKLLNTIEYQGYDITNEYFVLENLEGERMSDKKLYLLTSNYTFSAGEGFAYLIQTHNRGLIIGETTGGGAHPVNFYPMENGIIAKIPIGRSINPITGTNWEAVGVIPDVSVPETDALKKALELIY